jgi:arylsulfatase A-like enzyme
VLLTAGSIRNMKTLHLIVAVVCMLMRGGNVRAADAGPNVLLLYIDNVGYGDLGCYGNKLVKTPNIDRLRAEGVRCTDFYTASPSCTPSRGAILTGRHPERNGLNWQLNAKQNIGGYGLPLTEKIIPQYLRPLGYSTAAFGKWNLGFAPSARPTERGFDEFLGHASGNIGYYNHVYAGQNDLRRGTEPVDMHGQYSTDLFADAAIDFIQRRKDGPWFVYLPFNAAHFVSGQNTLPGEKPRWQVPAKYLAMYGWSEIEPDEKRRFLAVMTALDDAIGRVVKTVDDLGLGSNTIVFLISDNGAFMLPHRGLDVQSNAPFREGGVTTYEGGVRVPAIIRWPKRIKPMSTCTQVVSSLDVLPTILAACGLAAPADRKLDGFDIAPVLADDKPSPRESLCWTWKQGKDQSWQAIRKRDWKLVRRTESAAWELYDLKADYGESKDLAPAKPELVKELAADFERWLADCRRDPTRGVARKN